MVYERNAHDKLYRSDDVSRIPVKEYIDELLTAAFSLSPVVVDIEADTSIDTLSSRQAIPVGLIINEIATNAIKHGFVKNEEAVFSVSLKKDESSKQGFLVLSNTGKPFPEDIDINNAETLELRLISTLTRQLGGILDLRRAPYPVFSVRFPLKTEGEKWSRHACTGASSSTSASPGHPPAERNRPE